MTDEEKEAIEYLRKHCKFFEFYYDDELHKQEIEKILNLIEKKNKIINEMAKRVYLTKEEYECVREKQVRSVHKSFEDCIIEYFEKKEV